MQHCHRCGTRTAVAPPAAVRPLRMRTLQHGMRSPRQPQLLRRQFDGADVSRRQCDLHIAAAGKLGTNSGSDDSLGRPARPSQLQKSGSSSASSEKADAGKSLGDGQFALSLAALIAFGVANRILYKLALVPMGNYVFFLAQFQTFGYCAVYFTALAVRYKTGAVSKAQLQAAPWKLLAFIGLTEAASQVLGFVGASKLPGVVLPLLQQSVMFWNLGFSKLILGKKLAWQQLVGATAVVAGVCTAALPAQGGVGVFSGGCAYVFSVMQAELRELCQRQVQPLYIGIFVLSMMFPALDSITKEKVFSDAKEKLKTEQLDIFVVNSFASGFQALSVTLMLPGLASLRGIGWQNLPSYLAEGVGVFMGANGNGAPLLPLLYVAANLTFNICSLLVVRSSGALVNSLAIAALTPLTIWAFTFNLPYLGAPPGLGPNFLAGSVILLAGLLTYNWPSLAPQLKQKFGKGD